MGFFQQQLAMAVMLRLLLLLCCSNSVIHLARAVAPDLQDGELDVPAMFTFGDSWSDSGNNNFLGGSLARADFSPNGVDFVAAAPTGRFTNGRTLNDYIGYFLGLDSQPPYLSLSNKSSETDMLRGVNFASGGAGILDESGAIFKERIPLSLQLNHFREVKHRLCGHLGVRKAHRLISKSLFFVTVGSSDYLHNYLLPGSESAGRYSPQEFQDMLVSSLSQQLKRLHSMGARKIAVAGVGPLGYLPGVRDSALYDGTYTSGLDFSAITQVAKNFNDAINGMMGDISNGLVGTFFTFSDTFEKIRQFVENPGGYGFGVANVSCCGLSEMACSYGTAICDNRASHVFWDKHHTTDRANLLLANYLTFGSDSAPFNLFDLARKK